MVTDLPWQQRQVKHLFRPLCLYTYSLNLIAVLILELFTIMSLK